MSGNGQTKVGETGRFLVAMVAAAVVAYFTAQISTENRLTTLETTQRLQWDEVQRALSRIEAALRDVKQTVAGQ